MSYLEATTEAVLRVFHALSPQERASMLHRLEDENRSDQKASFSKGGNSKVYDPAYLDSLILRAREHWHQIGDADLWLRNLRGYSNGE